MSKLQFSARFAAGRVDPKAGIIYDVCLAMVGPARGHGVMVDRTTLEQLRDCARHYSGGLKVKMTHRGNVGDIVGALKALRVEGDKLLGDLHLLETYEKRAYVLELADKMADTFGLSVAFSGGEEERGGLRYARCTEIYSCDLESETAATPEGLFCAQIDAGAGVNLSPQMTPDEIKAIALATVNTALVEFGGRIKAVEDGAKALAASTELSALKTQLTELSTQLTATKTEFSAKLGDDAKRIELAAQTVAKEFAGAIGKSTVRADGGGNGGAGGGEGDLNKAALDAFDATLTKHFAASGSKTRTWQLAQQEDTKGYELFLRAQRKPAFESVKK